MHVSGVFLLYVAQSEHSKIDVLCSNCRCDPSFVTLSSSQLKPNTCSVYTVYTFSFFFTPVTQRPTLHITNTDTLLWRGLTGVHVSASLAQKRLVNHFSGEERRVSATNGSGGGGSGSGSGSSNGECDAYALVFLCCVYIDLIVFITIIVAH